MKHDRHTQIQIILGMIVEGLVIGAGVLKGLQLLNRLFEWCVAGMTQTMISLGIAAIILLVLGVMMYDQRHSLEFDEGEFYEKFGGNQR